MRRMCFICGNTGKIQGGQFWGLACPSFVCQAKREDDEE